MRPRIPLPRDETSNVIYRIHYGSCAVTYVGETGKRLQTCVTEQVRVLRRMDPLSRVAKHCANSGHTFAFQNAEILGRGNYHVPTETIEAWHTETTSINRCVALPVAYQALRVQLIERKSNQGIRPNLNPTTGEPRTDMHATTPQFGADEGAVINTAASTTKSTDEKTCSQQYRNMTIDPGRQLRSMRTRAMPPTQRETCQLTAIILLPPSSLR
ncbi:unnamed protein product [Schistocephalus solidus]|uniref:Uncharacterized protein n=1 Tax=Schistocephalus solidus TaxID=70667 RepID=A0A183TCD1_SCHSO|nr:unnamed protein product [Schistocephalus solidus]